MRKIKKQNKFFVIGRIVFLFIMVLAIALVVAISKMDMNTLRGNILSVLRNATGMPVEISGDVSWKLSLRPRVTMRDVSIPNPVQTSKNRDMFRAKSVEVGLDLLSLFTSRPTIQRVYVNDAVVFLDKNDKGRYPVFENDSDENTDTADSGVQIDKPEYPFVDPGLGSVTINGLNLNVDGEKYSLARISVRYSNVADKREYRGWVKIKNDVIPFIASFDKYNAERKVYPVRFAFSSDGDALVANIALEGTSKMPIDFIIKGDIPDVRPIGELLNTDFPKMPAIKVNIAGGLGYDKLTLHKSSIAVRGSEMTISGSFDWGKKTPDININIASKKINLLELFPGLYGSTVYPMNYRYNVFQDMPLFGEYLYGKNITLNVEVGRFVMYRNLSLDDMKVKGKIQGANLRIDADTGFVDGHIVAAIDGTVSENGVMNLEMGGIGKNITIGELMNQIYVKDFISELPMDFETYVRASGANMSQIMKTITGPVLVHSAAGGYAHADLVEYMYGTDFLTSLRHSIHDMFSSNKKYNQMHIDCAVTNLKLRNGLAETTNGVAIQTNAINVMLDGSLNLGDENVNMSLTTIPVRGLKLSISGNIVNTITITGNLAEPDIRISGAAVAGKALSATGLGLLLAPFTGGLGLVAGAGVGLLAGDLLENWLADSHPCETALRKGAPEHKGDPDWMNLSVAELANGVINPQPAGDSDK
jgi:hypothetical protein